MEESAYILELLAGVFFVLACSPLLHRAVRDRRVPERLLGITFLLMGVSYLLYELPLAFANERLFVPFSVLGRLSYDASVISTALFTRYVFHREAGWATALTWMSALLIASGLVVSALHGDWEGLAPLSNPGFWLEWVGQVVPFVWVAVSGLAQRAKSRRRMRVGLSDAMVCNRFLLFSLFGVMQIITLIVVVPQFIAFEEGEGFTAITDLLLGIFEMLTILVIWLAFFPPRVYRGWIAGRLPAGAAAGIEQP